MIPMNGKEIDPEFVTRVREVTGPLYAAHEIREVLHAVLHIVKEKEEFYPGQKVRDENGREGEIILHPTDTHIWARFGSTKVMTNKEKLTKIE